MFLANFESPKIASVIMEPFSIPKVAKNGQKEPDFEISEIKPLCLIHAYQRTLLDMDSPFKLFISHFELNQFQNNAK